MNRGAFPALLDSSTQIGSTYHTNFRVWKSVPERHRFAADPRRLITVHTRYFAAVLRLTTMSLSTSRISKRYPITLSKSLYHSASTGDPCRCPDGEQRTEHRYFTPGNDARAPPSHDFTSHFAAYSLNLMCIYIPRPPSFSPPTSSSSTS